MLNVGKRTWYVIGLVKPSKKILLSTTGLLLEQFPLQSQR